MGDQPQQYNLAKLSIEQLGKLKQALESEVDQLMSAHMHLRNAFNRMSNSKETIRRFATQDPGHEMLVPLTNSLYVPGKIENVESLLVDVGTGYFIEKSSKQAQKFLGRKVSQVAAKQIELEKSIGSKRGQLEQVMNVMAQKSRIMQAVQAQQAQQAQQMAA
jgi:prefoldin alpha subunit